MTKLRKIRTGLGLSQVELAARAHLALVTIYKAEKDPKSVSRRSMGKIAVALRIPVDELLKQEAPDDTPPMANS